jgi:hypothetical protein
MGRTFGCALDAPTKTARLNLISPHTGGRQFRGYGDL